MEFRSVRGDIAARSADALVNAAGTRFQMGSGVAGFDLTEEARIIAETIAEYDASVLSDIQFIACSNEEYETVRAAAESVRPET
ncbi:MAG: O-acetyl-ADP-ribose deacetylase (regulator of RNase III) [Natronomonas sp.]|jgi:O-acetyl-ADP-ribose deacetylase (regulator of RNase III)|uniref:hypothetical protein n=1 Tax=Natronomonas sp. TaxID=2184060 RepID=UPI003988BA87